MFQPAQGTQHLREIAPLNSVYHFQAFENFWVFGIRRSMPLEVWIECICPETQFGEDLAPWLSRAFDSFWGKRPGLPESGGSFCKWVSVYVFKTRGLEGSIV